MSKNFDDLYKKVAECSKKKVSVAVAQDAPVLEAVEEARVKGIADAILVGDKDKIEAIAKEIGIDINNFEVIDEKDDVAAAKKAVSLVHDGTADMYMKGLVDTKTFLKSVLDKEVGLRTDKVLSHVCVFEIKGRDKLMFVTDVAFLPYPTKEEKVAIIENTVEIANACGVDMPKVAPVTAVEVVNPKMPETVEAAELTQMNEDGIIKNCIVDGPISVDIAIDEESAKHKGAGSRKIAGDADILLMPDIQAGNIAYKILTHLVDGKNGNILTGTKKPVILTSRADSKDVKVNSLALGAVVAEYLN